VSGEAGEHFRTWLRAGMTGCEFAKLLPAKAGRVAIELHLDATLAPTDWLNSAFDEYAKSDRAVIAVFPLIVTELAFVEFLNALDADSRWALRRRSKLSPTGGVLVGLEWTTAAGDISDTMGFAPFASMPVPRRAPYVAIATWPGGRSNPFRGRTPTPPGRAGEVSFLDAAHGFDQKQYEDHWAKTVTRVATLMSVPPDDASLYRRSAFVLPAEYAMKLEFGETRPK
jgi:hypothetical protein